MSSQVTPRTHGRRRHLQQMRALLLLLTCAVALLGCATPTRDKIRLEAYSWWTRDSERNAFDQVLGIYNAKYRDSEAINQVTTDVNADEVRAMLTARLLAGAPPSTFQANAGADLLRWTAMDTTEAALPSASRVTPLDGLFQRTGLTDALPRDLYQALLAGPQLRPYAVPLNIHRLNLIYFNTAALERYKAAHAGSSFLDPAVLCPNDVATRLDDPDARLELRIAVGTKDSFTLTLLALENMLPAVKGTTLYNEVSGGTLYDELFLGTLTEAEWHEPVVRALQCVQYLSRSFLRTEGLSWADALIRVETGDADFSVMGDWANGELKGALEEGRVDVQPFPGSESTFVFTSDTFPLPVAAPYAEESENLLETLASTEAQLAFSREKGSIPARADISTELVREILGDRAAQTRRDFDSAAIHKSIATSGLFPPYYPDDLSARLSAMTAEGASKTKIEPVVALLRNALPLLERWQRRIREGQQAP
ncbi:MAG TPA: ABC transporter substrate-binding protein [Polyangiaceae bacterium]|nr:ABC transporter substrate-binding protein [Polyangiaceae bacterium]